MRTSFGSLVLAALAGCMAEPAPPSTTVEVRLDGGQHPGTYSARSTLPACTRNATGHGSLEIQLSDWSGPSQGLRSLQLVVPADSAAGDSVFYLGLVFGDLFTGTVHEIETRPGAERQKGRGRVRIEGGPTERTVAITGKTSDSVAIAATIQCHRVLTPDASGR